MVLHGFWHHLHCKLFKKILDFCNEICDKFNKSLFDSSMRWNGTPSDFFVAKIGHFAIKEKHSQATYSRELFENFPKNLPHFQEESNEISKILGGFG